MRDLIGTYLKPITRHHARNLKHMSSVVGSEWQNNVSKGVCKALSKSVISTLLFTHIVTSQLLASRDGVVINHIEKLKNTKCQDSQRNV